MIGARVERIDKTKTLVVFGLALVALMAVSLLLTARDAHAKTFLVNSLANPGSGGCNATQCTLKEAVGEAGTNGVTDTINFKAGLSGEIDLHNSLEQGGFSILNDTPAVDLTINGPGAGVLAINGNNETRAFGIASGAKATISGLTIRNGKAHAGDPNGGGIANSGTLTLNNSTVSINTATNAGGGINNNRGTVTLNNSTVSGNKATSLGGGGIYNTGTVTLNNSTVSGNEASEAGGIYNDGGTLTLNRSTLSGNTANHSGGGIRSDGGLSGTQKTTTITNSTISGNTASSFGGGIHNDSGLTAIAHTTITNNTAPAGQGSGVASVGDTSNSRTEVLATIISANPGTDVDIVQGTTTSFSSKGFNLIGHGNAALAFNQPGDQNGVSNPGLGLLAFNGGPTKTHALVPGSPAIDLVTTGCPPPATDQRGVARPRDGDKNGNAFCDKGAYERSDTTPPRVIATAPTDGQTGVRRNANLTATFSEKMDRTTLNRSTFKLFKINSDNSTTQVANVMVSSTADGLKASLNPFGTSATLLAANSRYRVFLTTGAKDPAGNGLDQSPTIAGNQQKVWTFTTGST
jgi:Bacterial Ig-like domain